MSLEAVAVALGADLGAEASLTLIHLADGANDHGITVPYLPLLAKKVKVDADALRVILDELAADGLISPVREHPFDFLESTEGFQLHLEQVPAVEHEESPWSQFARAAQDTEDLCEKIRKGREGRN